MSDLPLIFVGNVGIVMIWKIRNIETMYMSFIQIIIVEECALTII